MPVYKFCGLPQNIRKNLKKEKRFLKKYTISVDPAAAKFYESIARRTGTTAEKLMSATLFRFAGELSVKAVLEKNPPKS